MENNKSKITAIILTKNEEDRIEDCLESLSFVHEIIVIDNGSTDKTVDIAKKHGASVFTSASDDFSKLRNFGLAKAPDEWVLFVDADERITPKLQSEILSLVKTFSAEVNPHGYFIKRKNYYLGHEWPYQDKLERLFWKNSLIRWEGKLHETAKVGGSVGRLSEPMLHYTHRSLSEMVDKTNKWSDIEAELRLAHNHPKVVPWRLIRVVVTGFYDSFVRQNGWKAGIIGWIESIYQAFSMFITYAKLWELQEKNHK